MTLLASTLRPHVILVDTHDTQIGTMEKLEAHQKGLLHRCFSVFLLNEKNELLIHKRASEKYHCGGLWTNTCCSHPQPYENMTTSAEKRLQEEMGIQASLKPLFSFIYKSEFENGLTEYEFDHVFVGYNTQPKFTPHPQEVEDYRWVSLETLIQDITQNPDQYTIWFRIILQSVFAVLPHHNTISFFHLGHLSLPHHQVIAPVASVLEQKLA